jgi:dTMP kinase
MYIVCEWVVWTGKTTQSKLLVDYLRAQYPWQEVIWTREPGGTPIAEAIRTCVQGTSFEEEMQPLTDVYLYAAARAQLLGSLIKPALERGAWVVSDRNVCSSLAYQWWAQGIGMETVRRINSDAVLNVMPTKILFFDLPVEIGLARTFDQEGDKWEKLDKSFFEKVYEWYTKIPEYTDLWRIYNRIDANGSVEEVHKRVIEMVNISSS